MTEQPSARVPYVFISYSSSDRDRALALADRLEQAAIRVWIDRHDIPGGSSWSAEIAKAIADCTVFSVLCSQPAMASENVQRELQLAMEEKHPLLPLLLEPVQPPPEVRYILAGRQWLELLDRPESDWLPRLLQALARLGLSGAGPAAMPAAQPAQPSPIPAPHAALGNLPMPLTSFVGREQELAEVEALLGQTRFLTLTGPGGTGKTRLALAVAGLAAASFPDGVWFVDLSGVSDPAGVIPAIAQVLGVRESEGRSLAVALAAYLRHKVLLLVLDNFEQVVDAAVALYDLLAEAPRLSLLVTSRILLRVPGEHEYDVPPLPVPDAGAAAPPEQLDHNPAVQLFVARARTLRLDFRLTRENAAQVAAICTRLDGLPLAIELAAARIKLLPPPALLARLDHRLSLLSAGERGRPARQQTLRGAIQWSWDLLEPAEQVLFRRLGVFAGGWTLEAAEAVCSPDGELDVLTVLESLLDMSLVRQTELDGEPRFSLLATLQEFALEQLDAGGEAAARRRGHATYFCTLAERTNAEWWRSGRMQQDVLRPLDPERENLIAALGWTLTQQDATLGLRLAGALEPWFYFRAPGEGQHWLERLLSLPAAATPSASRGRALFCAGNCALVRAAQQAGCAYLEEAATLFRAEEDLLWLSRTLTLLSLAVPATEVNRVPALVEAALRLARAVGGTHDIARAEMFAGSAPFWYGGNRTGARGHLEEALRLARSLEADWLTMAALRGLAILMLQEGQHEAAGPLFQEALPLAEALGNPYFALVIRSSLALLAGTAGDPVGAAAHWRRALLSAHEMGSALLTALGLAGIAGLLSAQQRPEKAAQLLAASDRLAQAGEQHPFYGRQFKAAYRQALAATEAAVSAEVFAQAWAKGHALSLDQAMALALGALNSVAAEAGDATSV